MTSYPINLTYSHKDGVDDEGAAETAEQVVALIQARRDGDWRVTGAEMRTTEVGSIYRTRAKFESVWRAELEAGWVSVIQVYAGFKGEARFWQTIEEEIDQ